MIFRRFLITYILAAGLVAALLPGSARAENPINVVATFSVLGDMVKNVGGDRVKVTTLVGPNGDTHVYQPTPAAAKAVAQSKVMFVNGLGFEGWFERLVESSGYKGKVITTTAGVEALKMKEEEEHHDDHDKEHHDDHKEGHDEDHEKHEQEAKEDHHDHHHGEFDPHAWHSLANARIYVRNIRDGLVAADPAGAESYRANAAQYLKEIEVVEAMITKAIKAIPPERRKVVTPHDAFGYLEATYGIKFLAPVGFSTEAEASARDVAKLISQIKKEKISAIFVENIADRRLIDQIVRETGAQVGGTLYSDALSKPDEPAGTYLNMMRHNIRTLVGSLGS